MIKEVIESVIPHFSETYMDMLSEISCRKEIRKDTIVLKQGQYCNYLWFIEEGAVKAYENVDGNDRVIYFYTENSFFSNYYCWVTQDTSDVTFQTVEACTVLEIDYPKLEALCIQHHIFDTIGRKIAEKLFVEEVQLRKLLVNYTAKGRYEYLEKHQPEIFQHFALKDIASFIGITDVSLSRIRKERLQRERTYQM